MLEQKKSFTLYKALTTANPENRKPTAFAAPAEPSPPHGQGCEPDPPIYDAAFSYQSF